MEELAKSSYAGFTLKVYPNRVEYKKLFQKNVIPINQIASVELGMPMLAQIVIETTGGKKYKIPVSLGSKGKIRDAIFQAQSGGQVSAPVSNADELNKLAELKERGVLTQEEFDNQKSKLLN